MSPLSLLSIGGNAINNFFDKNGVEDQTFDNLTYKFILHLENFDTFGLKKYSFFKWRTNSTNGESPNGVQISKWRMTICTYITPVYKAAVCGYRY